MPAPENNFRKLILHLIDEMSWPHLGALGLLCFFFFFGAKNGLSKLIGRDIASIDFPLGPILGITGALLVMILCAITKLRPKP